jgi:hypothetical protein
MKQANIVTMTREEYDQIVISRNRDQELIEECEEALNRANRKEPFVEFNQAFNWYSGRRFYNPDEATKQMARERDNAVEELKTLRGRNLWERILNK